MHPPHAPRNRCAVRMPPSPPRRRGDGPLAHGGAARRAPGRTAPRARAGLTLVELAMTVAISGLIATGLLGLLDLGLRRARIAACAGNLRQLGMAALAYAADHDDRLPAERNFGIDDPGDSPAWFNRLPPYFGLSDRDAELRLAQCAGFRRNGARGFANASPKSFKMNTYLDSPPRPRHYRVGSTHDESEVVLFVDAEARETGMGQWGHCVPAAVDDSRHRGRVNVLHLDGHGTSCVATPSDRRWQDALTWKSVTW